MPACSCLCSFYSNGKHEAVSHPVSAFAIPATNAEYSILPPKLGKGGRSAIRPKKTDQAHSVKPPKFPFHP